MKFVLYVSKICSAKGNSHLNIDLFQKNDGSGGQEKMLETGEQYEGMMVQFNNVTVVNQEINWQKIKITRIEGQHGSGTILPYMGEVSGYVLQSENEPTISTKKSAETVSTPPTTNRRKTIGGVHLSTNNKVSTNDNKPTPSWIDIAKQKQNQL